jgi:hypothetical protein
LSVRITHIFMLWIHKSNIHVLFVSLWVAHLESYFVLWSVPQLHCQWSSNPPFFWEGAKLSRGHMSPWLWMSYILQELLEGLTYQESLLGM